METTCRLCLARNIRMHLIVNTELQHVYEKLTDYKLVSDARPLQACYICYAGLKHCYQLMTTCFRSEEILTQILIGKWEISQDSSYEKHGSFKKLSSSPVINLTFDDGTLPTPEPITAIKKEIQSNDNSYDMEIKLEVEENQELHSQPDTLVEMPLIGRDQYLSDPKNMPFMWSEPELLTVRATKTCGFQKARSKKKSAEAKNNKKIGNGNTLKCSTCQKCFSNKGNLKLHQLIHTSERPYVCDFCFGTFNHPSLLKKHIRNLHTNSRHTGDAPFKCEMCELSFKLKASLINHMRVHNTKPISIHECHICKNTFGTENLLCRHVRDHTGGKPYKCDICMKEYNHIQSLRRHRSLHSNVKYFICDTCSRSFHRKSDLVVHIRVHTGERPFKCNICHKSWTVRSNLNKHMLHHMSDKAPLDGIH